MAIEITKDNYETEVISAKEKVLIDFWAPWCGPCKALSPLIDEISIELEGRVKICKVNVDEQPDLAIKFGVMSIPTLAVMSNGEVLTKAVGLQSKEAILAMLDI